MSEVERLNINDKDFVLRRSQRIAAGLLVIAVISLLVVLFFEIQHEDRHESLLISLGLIFLLNYFLAYSRLQDFRRIRERLVSEHTRLEEANVSVKKIGSELQLRQDQESKARLDGEWLNLAARSISDQFKGFLESSRIAEFLTVGLGRELKADSVVCYSFDEELWPGFVKQWHRNPETKYDDALISKFESELQVMIRELWHRREVLVVNDSQLIDSQSRPIPGVAEISKQIARSWVIVPVADGSSVLGFVSIMMTEESREWSPIEIQLVKRVSSEAASVCVHNRIFTQSLQIANNDAEVERLVELGKVKNSFIENMNHELRTPLTSIIGYLEVILDDVDGDVEPDLVSSLTAVQRNALRLQVLIENMMQISKTDFEHVPLIVSTVDVGHLLGDVVNSLQLGAEDGGVGVVLRLDSPAGDLIIDGDINQLEQVFVNLLSNAIKFTPRDGLVTVSVRRFHVDGDCVEVKVADTGIGIPAKEFPNVFQRFFRATTATQASIPGFGIGLSLVHSIVSEHDGTVTFDSTVGKGTVFTVKLPTRHQSSPRSKVTT